jgi:hypothetical protein
MKEEIHIMVLLCQHRMFQPGEFTLYTLLNEQRARTDMKIVVLLKPRMGELKPCQDDSYKDQ